MFPVLQFFARRPNTYWLPTLAIEPSKTAALAGSLADLLGDLGSQPRIFRPSHQSQRLLDLPVRNQTEERRLLQFHGQPLTQRVVKNRIAGLVIEIGQDDACPSR